MSDLARIRSVLFICTANRYRSPIAAALLAAKVKQLGQSGEWLIGSAGTWAEPGLRALPAAEMVIAKWGCDLRRHRSRTVNAPLLESATVILVMSRHHREAICAEFPAVAHKTHLLSSLIGQEYDIKDPLSGTEDDYEQCAETIGRIIEAGFERLVGLTMDPHHFPST